MKPHTLPILSYQFTSLMKQAWVSVFHYVVFGTTDGWHEDPLWGLESFNRARVDELRRAVDKLDSEEAIVWLEDNHQTWFDTLVLDYDEILLKLKHTLKANQAAEKIAEEYDRTKELNYDPEAPYGEDGRLFGGWDIDGGWKP